MNKKKLEMLNDIYTAQEHFAIKGDNMRIDKVNEIYDVLQNIKEFFKVFESVEITGNSSTLQKLYGLRDNIVKESTDLYSTLQNIHMFSNVKYNVIDIFRSICEDDWDSIKEWHNEALKIKDYISKQD